MTEIESGAEKSAERSADESNRKEGPTTRARPLNRVVDEPRPAEVANELAQHLQVRHADIQEDCQSALVVATLTAGTDSAPRAVVATIYRRCCYITDISPVAGRTHRRVEARPEEWSASSQSDIQEVSE